MNALIPQPSAQESQITTMFANKADTQIMVKRGLVIAGTVAAAVVAVPMIIAIAHGIFAVACIGILGGAGYVAKQRIPHWIIKGENRVKELMQQEANRHIAALKAEAKQNPIEQAENDYIRRSQQYQQFKAALENIGGQVNKFKSMIDNQEHLNQDRKAQGKDPIDMTQEKAALAKMSEFYENRKLRLIDARDKLVKFKDKIDEAKTRWEFQKAANTAINAMNATDKDNTLKTMLTEVAFDSVQQEFDQVFARLDVDAVELSSTKALDFGATKLDTSTINIK